MTDYFTPEEKRAARRSMKQAKAREAQDDTAVQSLMSSIAGRAWMHDILDACGVFRRCAHENPYFTYFNEGQRNIGLMLLAAIMRACPQAYIQMMEEVNGGRSDTGPDRADPDDERNYDGAGRWIGTGDDPRDEDDGRPDWSSIDRIQR